MSTERRVRGWEESADRVPHFLLVDDDELITRSVCRVLRVARPRWALVAVPSASAAVRELARRDFDVVISDLVLPGLPGTALLEFVRSRYPKSVRVVFSGLVEVAARHPEVQEAHEVLAKPTTPQDLVSALARALRTGAGMRITLRPPAFVRPAADAASSHVA